MDHGLVVPVAPVPARARGDRGVRADVRLLDHRRRGWRRAAARELRDAGLAARSRRGSSYPIGITLPITGLAMIAVRRDQPVRARVLVARRSAIVLYLIAYGYSFFVQRKLRRAGHRADVGAAPARRERSAAGADGARRRIQRGGMVLGILLVAIVFLMVVKPTHLTALTNVHVAVRRAVDGLSAALPPGSGQHPDVSYRRTRSLRPWTSVSSSFESPTSSPAPPGSAARS